MNITKKYKVLSMMLALTMIFLSSCSKDTTKDNNIINVDNTGSKDATQEQDTKSNDTAAADDTGSAVKETDSSNTEGSVIAVDNTSFFVSETKMTLNTEDTDTSEEGAITVTMNGSSISADSMEGLTIDGSRVTITAAGVYLLTGSLQDGSICIAAGSKDEIHLIFDQLTVSNSNGAALFSQSGKLTITLKAGTVNTLSDGAEYTEYSDADNAPTACLFSQDDLTINGTGALVVNAVSLDGITVKDDFKLVSGSVTVTAGDDGIVGRDSLEIYDGTVAITAGGDGLKSSNDEKNEKGYVYVGGGSIVIDAAMDGIQAVSSLLIADGELAITAGGGSGNAAKSNGMSFSWGSSVTESSSESTKGLKADCNLVISGGNIVIDSADDAIHSNLTVAISGGSLSLAAGDDGIHADTSVTVTDGEINITKSYEGIEAATINMDGGTIRLVSEDDGINATEGSGTTSVSWGMGGGMSSGNALLNITGGYLYINAAGDGLDSNGSVVMSGGICIIDGPTNSGNGSLDYDSTFTQTGGVLIAVGAAGMAQTISTGGQCFVSMTYRSTQSAGSVIRLTDSEGNNIVTYTPSKSYSNVIISAPELINGESYVLSIGGSISGNETDGLYEDNAVYTAGTTIAEFTITDSGSYFSENGQTTGGQGGFGGGQGGFGGGDKGDFGGRRQ